jgi:hypothetical protein
VGYTCADPAAVGESEPQSGQSAELRWRHGLAQRPRGRRNSIRYLFSLRFPRKWGASDRDDNAEWRQIDDRSCHIPTEGKWSCQRLTRVEINGEADPQM